MGIEAMNEIDEILRGAALCRSFPDSVTAKLAQMGRLLEFPAGSLLFREGEIHPFVYLVVAGNVRLDIYVQGRGNVELMTLTAGDLLGWSPLVEDRPMSLRATTQDTTRLIRFDAPAIRRFCEQDYEFGYHFMRVVATAFAKRLLATRLQLLDLYAESCEEAS